MKRILNILEKVKKVQFYQGTYKHQFDYNGGILTLFLSKSFTNTGEETQLTYDFVSEDAQYVGIVLSIKKFRSNQVRRSSTLFYNDETYSRIIYDDLKYNNLTFMFGDEIIKFDFNKITEVDEDTLFQYGTYISNISEKFEVLNYMFENNVHIYTCSRFSDTELYYNEVLKFISNVKEIESGER